MSAELHIEKHLNQTLVNKQSVSTGLFDASTQASGSSSVFVNGKALARIGDSVACGSFVATGSSDVISG